MRGTFAIVGAGLSGVTCAAALASEGLRVVVFDKGRRPGGRLSSRHLATERGDAAFDYGAPCFTARDQRFQRQVALWHAAGLVLPWPAAGADAWVGTPSMDTLVMTAAAGLEVYWSSRVESLRRDAFGGWRLQGERSPGALFDAVLIAVPAEQAAPLLAPHDTGMARCAASPPSAPCWTVMAAFPDRLMIEPDAIRDSGPIGWASRDSAKPGRTGPESWVIQAGPEWSKAHLEDTPDAVIAALLAALGAIAKQALPSPLVAVAHRWRFSRSGSAGASMMWNAALGLGACGDWLIGPGVEAAWLSGMALADAVIRTCRA